MRNPFGKSDPSGASFLPQDYVARKNEMRANLFCLSLFGVVMFGVVAAFFVTNRQWLTVQAQQKAITVQYTQEATRIEQYKRLESQKSEMMDKAEVATALVEKVPRSKLLSEVVTRMPQDITLLEIRLAGTRAKEVAPPNPALANQIKTLGGRPPATVAGGKAGAGTPPAPPKERIVAPRFDFKLSLIGVARVNTDVADYIESLKACTILENVDLRAIEETTIDRVALRKFEIEATIRRDADARALEHVDLRTATTGGLPGANPTRPGGSASSQKASVRTAPGSTQAGVNEKEE
jgi:Tfp pilus assembly protein PilN